MKKQVELIYRFKTAEFPEQFRKLSEDQIMHVARSFLMQAVMNSEDSAEGLFGTIVLADGREAKVQLTIEAEYIRKEIP